MGVPFGGERGWPDLGIVGIHPGSFRKSGKQRSCRIRKMEEHTEDGRSRKQMRQGKQRRQRKGIGKEGWRCTYGPGEAERKDHNVLYHQIRQSQDNSELVQELTIKGQRLGVNIVGRTSARRWGIVANQRQMQNPDRAKATGAQESRLKSAGLRSAARSDLEICENGKLFGCPR